MESTDLVLMKSVTVNDTDANGARMSFTQVTSNTLNNMFPNVTQTERTNGTTRYRKFFFRNKNAANETGSNARVWISSKSVGGDYFRLKAGTDTDVQSAADDYTNWLGSGYLSSVLAADSTTLEVLFDTNDGVYAGSRIRISDSSGGEEFLTVATAGVSWNSNTATITTTTSARNTYPASQNSIVAGVVDLSDLVAATAAWSETSVSGTYDEASYPVEVNNVGTVTETWTLTFTNATAFTVSGASEGSLGAGSTLGNFQPVNTGPGTGDYYFVLRAAGWGGTWALGDTVTFTTTHSSASVWLKEVVPAGTSAQTNNLVSFKLYAEGA